MFYEKGINNILNRRKIILSFLEFVVDTPCHSYKFGHGGLSLKFNEYCLLNKI